MRSKYIYRIEHSMAYSGDENCLIIESNISPFDMQRIVVYICYRFDELVCDPLPIWNFDIDREHLLDILISVYNVKNIKNNLSKTLISASTIIDESIQPLDQCYCTLFNNVYYMDIFDLWEFGDFSGEWKEKLTPYLQMKEDKIDLLILKWKNYKDYEKIFSENQLNMD